MAKQRKKLVGKKPVRVRAGQGNPKAERLIRTLAELSGVPYVASTPAPEAPRKTFSLEERVSILEDEVQEIFEALDNIAPGYKPGEACGLEERVSLLEDEVQDIFERMRGIAPSSMPCLECGKSTFMSPRRFLALRQDRAFPSCPKCIRLP